MMGQSFSAAQRAWRRRILVSTWLAYAGYYFCRKSFYIAKGDLGRDLGFSASDLGQVGTAYLLAYTVGQFASAGLGTRYGARALLLAGMAGSVGANVVFGFANNLHTFAAFMVLNGLAQATGWPSTVGTVAAWTHRAERGTLMGFWATCYQVGGLLANAWAGFWLVRTGWRGAFFAASLVLAVVWCVVWLYQRNRPADVGLEAIADDHEEHPTRVGEVDDRWRRDVVITVGLLGTFYFGVKFVRYALWSWAPYFLQERFGLAGDEAAYLSSAFDVAGVAGVIAAGFFSDRFFASKRAGLSFLMLLGMTAACGFLVLFGGLGVWAFGVGLVLVGFMLYGPDSLLSGAGAIEIGSRRQAIAALGIVNGMGSLGSVLQETVIASAYEGSKGDMAVVFGTLFGASALALAAIGVVLVRNRLGHSDV